MMPWGFILVTLGTRGAHVEPKWIQLGPRRAPVKKRTLKKELSPPSPGSLFCDTFKQTRKNRFGSDLSGTCCEFCKVFGFCIEFCCPRDPLNLQDVAKPENGYLKTEGPNFHRSCRSVKICLYLGIILEGCWVTFGSLCQQMMFGSEFCKG